MNPGEYFLAEEAGDIQANTGRRTTLTALEKILAFGSAAGANVLIYH